MKIIPTPDNELEVWEGNHKVGLVDENDLYALTDYNNITERHLVERCVTRNEIIPALKQWFKEEQQNG